MLSFIHSVFELTFYPFMYGLFIFLSDLILPVLFLFLASCTFTGLKRMFFGFVGSFVFTSLLISLIVKFTKLAQDTVHYTGILFLVAAGVLLIFNQVKDSLVYGLILGFIWSFWVGIFKDFPEFYPEPKNIDFVVIYTQVLRSFGMGLLLCGVAYLAFRFLPKGYTLETRAALGYLSIFTAIILAFHIVNTSFRQELKVDEVLLPPPEYSMFND